MEIIAMSLHLPISRHAQRAFTLIDVMGAVVVVVVAFSGIFAANSRSMSLLKSAKQAAIASKCLQQRIEQIRNYNWTQITDSDPMVTLYATPPLPAVELPGFWEQVTISTYPSPTPSVASLVVTRNTAGTAAFTTENVDLNLQSMVRVDVQINWPGPGGRTRMRETSVIIANGGIGR